jgi:hypothetical protein
MVEKTKILSQFVSRYSDRSHAPEDILLRVGRKVQGGKMA